MVLLTCLGLWVEQLRLLSCLEVCLQVVPHLPGSQLELAHMIAKRLHAEGAEHNKHALFKLLFASPSVEVTQPTKIKKYSLHHSVGLPGKELVAIQA